MGCNEAVGAAVEKIPSTMQTALEDLGNYHSGTTTQLRATLTRSLDIASEAILADLDSESLFAFFFFVQTCTRYRIFVF